MDILAAEEREARDGQQSGAATMNWVNDAPPWAIKLPTLGMKRSESASEVVGVDEDEVA